MNPTIELLRTRRSAPPRTMIEPGPDSDQLRQILEVALRVPDHGKLGPWKIQVLDKAAQKKLGDAYAEFFAADYPDPRPEQIEFERGKASLAPTLLVVSSQKVLEHKIPVIEQVLSGAAVCQNVLIATHALGYVANWVTGWPAYDARVKAVLGIAPHDEILGIIYLGSAGAPPDERPRKTVEQAVEFWHGPA